MERINNLPLNSYRVLDLTDEKGYVCGKILADLGADVIKIEPPDGDPGRNNGPFFHNIPDKNKSLCYFAYNTNKRGITLNIETSDGKDIFKRLAKKATFIIESFIPGHMDDIGIGYKTLQDINPGLILVSISHFGQTGPYSNFKSSDIVNIGMGGLSYITGSPDHPPVRICTDQSYVLAGIQSAMGAMIAQYYLHKTGKGQHVDTSIQQSVLISAMTIPQMWDLQKYNWSRAGAFVPRSGKLVRHLWQCKDGYVTWRIFGGSLGLKTRALVEWMEEEGMADDLGKINWLKMDYLSVDHKTFYHWQEVFGEFIKAHTKEEIKQEALRRSIVMFPVSTPKDLLNDPQLSARGYWKTIKHPELDTEIVYPGPFYQSTSMEWKFEHPPTIGEHNESIYLNELGLTNDDIILLKKGGVI
jgi:crotonobetainyl-CoA:carnitine CoA-transferase CaiB-like acyl-CoA transferase